MTTQPDDLFELKSAIHAFKIVGAVLSNSTFKPEHFEKISITVGVVSDVMAELQKQLDQKINDQATVEKPAKATKRRKSK